MSDESFDEERRHAFMDAPDAPWNRGLGMTLRDYFAAQALLTYSAIYRADLNLSWAETANACYEIADAMLAERAK